MADTRFQPTVYIWPSYPRNCPRPLTPPVCRVCGQHEKPLTSLQGYHTGTAQEYWQHAGEYTWPELWRKFGDDVWELVTLIGHLVLAALVIGVPIAIVALSLVVLARLVFWHHV